MAEGSTSCRKRKHKEKQADDIKKLRNEEQAFEINKLGPELLHTVFGLMPPLDLIWNCRGTCKSWRNHLEDSRWGCLKSLKGTDYPPSITVAIPESGNPDKFLVLNNSMSKWRPLDMSFLRPYLVDKEISCVASDGGLLCLGIFNKSTARDSFLVCSPAAKKCMQFQLDMPHKARRRMLELWTTGLHYHETRRIMLVTNSESLAFEVKYLYSYWILGDEPKTDKAYYLRMKYNSTTGASVLERQCGAGDSSHVLRFTDTAVMKGVYYTMVHLKGELSLQWSHFGFIMDEVHLNYWLKDNFRIRIPFGLVREERESESLTVPCDMGGVLVVFKEDRLFFAVVGCSDVACRHLAETCGDKMHIYELKPEKRGYVKLGKMPEKFFKALLDEGDGNHYFRSKWPSRCYLWGAHQHGNSILFHASGGNCIVDFQVPDADQIVPGADGPIDEALWKQVSPPPPESPMHMLCMNFNLDATLPSCLQ